MSYSYHNIAPHRGKHRVWIANQSLVSAGFKAGMTYVRNIDEDSRVITLCVVNTLEEQVQGRVYTVTGGSGGESIIDLCNQTISKVYGEHQKVRVEYLHGTLIVTLHHVCKLSDDRVKRFKENLKRGVLTSGTFCAGIGMSTLGIHEGFNEHGIKIDTRWILDRESKFTDAAVLNNTAISPTTKILNATMEEFEPSLVEPVDIFQVSMSCKVHSKASRFKQKRNVAEEHDDAAGLYGLFKALEPINAAVFVSENVVEAKDSASFIILKSVLKALHYKIYEFVINNTQSGSLENRNRYWLVAVNEQLPDIIPAMLPIYPKQYSNFGEIMEVFPADDKVWRYHTATRVEKTLRDKEKGNGFSNGENLTADSTYIPCVRAEYCKNGSSDSRVQGEGESYRMLTAAEHCKAKSAPLSLIHNLSTSFAHFVLGQGVDMNQAKGISELICMCLSGFVDAGKISKNLISVAPAQGHLF